MGTRKPKPDGGQPKGYVRRFSDGLEMKTRHKELLYDRVANLVAIYDDQLWRAKLSAELNLDPLPEDAVEQALEVLVDDLELAVCDLIPIFRRYDRAEWAEAKLIDLHYRLLAEHAAATPAEPARRRRTAKVSELESLQNQNARLKSAAKKGSVAQRELELAKLRIAELELRNAQLEEENRRLRGMLAEPTSAFA